MRQTPLLEPREVAQRTGLTIDTLRYYEREGLVGPIERHSGQRRYTEDDVAWIGLITCLRSAGLGIADLRRFADLLRTEAGHGRVAFLRRRREELLERLTQTQAAINVLDDKISYYSSRDDDTSS
jgi:DNA-binding transcriptional MerR regulator